MDVIRSPRPPDFGEDALRLAVIAARHCLLPHPDVVAATKAAIFPTIRASSTQARMTVADLAGRQLMHDDNMTPRWAFLWSHGIAETGHPKGWTFAHVWTDARNPDIYTHLANLALVPEALASLTDKVGPLTAFLRYHAQEVYRWRPTVAAEVQMPDGYSEVAWAYMPPYADPMGFITARLASLSNERVLILRRLMTGAGLPDAP